jgi:FG-GAP repeat
MRERDVGRDILVRTGRPTVRRRHRAAVGPTYGLPAPSNCDRAMTHRTALHLGRATPLRVTVRVWAGAALLALVLLGAGFSNGLASEPAPLVQQGPKLTGGEELGAGRFGRSVALSEDGDTALIGGPRDGDEAGAAWVFTRSGSTWTQLVKLTGAGELGAGCFGRSVALSADGDTALVGAPRDNSGLGAVWVFTRSGATWVQQAELTGSDESGRGWFGRSVALSADGDTALVGGYVDHSNVGAAWVFRRSSSTWTQQGSKLTGAEEAGAGEFGWSVALSGDGETALVGGREDGGGVGAAWVFVRSGSTWAQQGSKLTGGEEAGAGEFGDGVALSGDGETALVGGREDAGGVGAAWVFVRSGSTWAQQGSKLTGGEEAGAGELGDSVALSVDGETALLGGEQDGGGVGAAWVFVRSGSAWAQQGSKLTGGEERGKGELGWSVALSGEGDTALIGGIGDSAKAGAAWAFGVPASSSGGEPPAGGVPSGGAPAGGEPTPGTQTQTPAGSPPGVSPRAKQGVGAYRAAGGGVVLVGRRVPVRGARARVVLRCTAPVACRGRLTLRLAPRARAARRSPTVTLATASFSIPRGRTASVKLKLDAAGRSRLRADRGRLGASLAIRVLVPDPPRTRAYVVELVSPAPL